MSNLIQDKILALAPAATVKEGEVLTVTVPAENFHAVAEMLRDDRETQFDFLVCMTGADWGETLGVVYHLAFDYAWATKWCCVSRRPTVNIRFCPVYATCGIRPT